ncbi:hypothetical protein ACA910_011374 [Epithemia clementina (nom. ined.)]
MDGYLTTGKKDPTILPLLEFHPYTPATEPRTARIPLTDPCFASNCKPPSKHVVPKAIPVYGFMFPWNCQVCWKRRAKFADFTFHHATNRMAVLNLWLPDAESKKVPEYATHHVGVGALVLNQRGTHILCVREQRNNYRPWKMIRFHLLWNC